MIFLWRRIFIYEANALGKAPVSHSESGWHSWTIRKQPHSGNLWGCYLWSERSWLVSLLNRAQCWKLKSQTWMFAWGWICILHEIMEWFLNLYPIDSLENQLSFQSGKNWIQWLLMVCFLPCTLFILGVEKKLVFCLLGNRASDEFTLPFGTGKLSAYNKNCTHSVSHSGCSPCWCDFYLYTLNQRNVFKPVSMTDPTGFVSSWFENGCYISHHSTCSSIGNGAAEPRADAQE